MAGLCDLGQEEVLLARMARHRGSHAWPMALPVDLTGAISDLTGATLSGHDACANAI